MPLYEYVAARLIGTPLQRPAEWLRRLRRSAHARKHPELATLHREGEWTEQVLRQVIRRDTSCVDVGCHIGSFLQRMLKMAPEGRHHAFEPVPHKAAWLRKRFPSVQVHECALGNVAETAEFVVNSEQTSLSSFKGRGNPAILKSTRVACRRLDDEIAAEGGIGFIKIDVNGAELLVLRGARKLLRRDRPVVLLECTLQGMKEHGFDAGDVFAEVTETSEYALYLPKDFLAHAPALDLAAFRKSMEYPFQTFNYVMVPRSS